MKKSAAAIIGTALVGTFLALSMQGSAQATTPPQVTENLTAEATTGEKNLQPMAIGGLLGKAAKSVGKAATKAAGKATVHGKAAGRSAVNSVGQATDMASLGSIFSPPSNISGDGTTSAETAFDR